MTASVQSTGSPIWTSDEATKIEKAAEVAKEIRSTIDKTVHVLTKLPQINAAYPLLSTYKSTLRGINPSEKPPESQNALELEKIVTEILHGNSIKANFGKLGRLLIPLATKDIKTLTSEEFLNLKEVLEKWIHYSKKPEILALLKNPTLFAEFLQSNDLPNKITDEVLKSELKCYERCYEVACECIMVTHVNVLNDQIHLSTLDELYKIAAYSLLVAQRLPDENYPGGVKAAVIERDRLENEIEGLNRVLTNPSIVQNVLEKAQKAESLSEQLLKTDDPKVAKSISKQIKLKELPVDIRLKALKLLSESSKYKRKTMKFVDSLLETPKM